MSRRGENIYKRKDGRWEGRYIKSRKIDGRVHYGYLYARKYSELKQQLLTVKLLHQKNYVYNKVNNHLYSGTLNTWVSHWFMDISTKVKPSTFASYRTKMNTHILPLLGDKGLSALTEEDVSGWLDQIRKSLSSSSVRVVFLVLKSCCAAAVKRGLIPFNPCQWIILPNEPSQTVQALSEQEQQLVVKGAEKHPNGLAIILALETGLRIGEISGLKWEDIDFNNQLLYVRRTVQRVSNVDKTALNKTVLIEGTPKSATSARVVPFSEKIMTLLTNRKQQQTGKFILGGKRPSEPRVITNWLKKICQIVSINHVPFHSLRHSFATRCIEKGVPITTISALLGHKSIKMTLDTYTNSFLTEKRKAIQLIS